MGAQQSKEELLYQQVNYGNVDGITALRRAGAGLEWIDKEGKTPLILASMRPELLNVVNVLIDLGANVNAYRPGSHAGTPLHHAAKRGLVQTVELLLSHGANPLVMNDDCQTALELARAKSHWNVVRLIESRICLFSGWLREVHGPSILEAFARHWVSRKIWAVVLPCDSRYSRKGPKYELAVYPELQVAQPHCLVPLWKVDIKEPILNQSDPSLVIVDKAAKKQYKFLPEREGDKRQLQTLYNACRGIPQNNIAPTIPVGSFVPNAILLNPNPSAASGSLPSTSEDMELAVAINASIQSAMAEGVPLPDTQQATEASNLSGWGSFSENATHNGWGPPAPSKLSTEGGSSEPSVEPYNGWGASAENATHNGWGPPAAPSKLSTQGQSSEPSVDPYNGWGASAENAAHNGWGPPAAPSKLSTQGQSSELSVDPYNGWSAPEVAQPEVRRSNPAPQPYASEVIIASAPEAPPIVAQPSAPLMAEETFYAGPIQYPSIDSTPVDLDVPTLQIQAGTSETKEGTSISRPIDATAPTLQIKSGSGEAKEGSSISGLCIICLDAPLEGACIPCGHVVGCMSCLKEISLKKWGCPVCRANIAQVIKLYAV